MTYEERLEAAERHRLKGNALFQQVGACELQRCTSHYNPSCFAGHRRSDMRHTGTGSSCGTHALLAR